MRIVLYSLTNVQTQILMPSKEIMNNVISRMTVDAESRVFQRLDI